MRVYLKKKNSISLEAKKAADLHEFGPDRLYVVVQEVRLEVVHTQLQSTEPLTDQCLGAIEGGHQGVHQHGQVGQEGAQADRHRQTQLNEQVLHVLAMEATL